jgi:hypothetical protein
MEQEIIAKRKKNENRKKMLIIDELDVFFSLNF